MKFYWLLTIFFVIVVAFVLHGCAPDPWNAVTASIKYDHVAGADSSKPPNSVVGPNR